MLCYRIRSIAVSPFTTLVWHAAVLLLATSPALADPPSCSAVDADPSIFTCSCVDTASNGTQTLVPTPDRCGDMLSGQRTLIRADEIILAQPEKTSTSPVGWATESLLYDTMPLSSNPAYGDFDTTGTLDVVNNPACEMTDAPPTSQRVRTGRLFDTKNDFLITLTTPNAVTADDCNPTDGSDNLEVHLRDLVTGDEYTPISFNATQAKYAQIAIADFNFDDFDDIIILTYEKVVVATATDVATPGDMTVYSFDIDLATRKPLNDPTTGDFNGDGIIDVMWIGGNFDAGTTTDRGDLTVWAMSVCPGDVADQPVCDGATAFQVVENPAALVASGVSGSSSNFSLGDLPGVPSNSASLEPNPCSPSTGVNNGPSQSYRSGALVLGNFDESNGLGATGLPIDELVVAYVSHNLTNLSSDVCSVDVWLFSYTEPTSTSPSWIEPIASEQGLFPEMELGLVAFGQAFPVGAIVNLYAGAAQLDWMGGPEQAVVAVGGGAGVFNSSSSGLETVNPSYIFPMSISVGQDENGDPVLEVCSAPDRSESTPSGDEGEKGTRILWGAALGRFTSTDPPQNSTVCSDPTAADPCPYAPQVATFGAEIGGFTGSGNELKLWTFQPSSPGGSSSDACQNDPSLATAFLPIGTTGRSVNFDKLEGFWDKAGSMVQVGDLYGNSMRVGNPDIVRVTSHTQPIAIIEAPPTHIDYALPSGAQTADLINLSAAPQQFFTGYQDATSTSEGATHQTTSSWSFSNTESVGVKVAYSAVPFVGTVSVQDQSQITEASEGTTTQALGLYAAESFSLNVDTGIRDAVRWQEASMNVFHYPILGSAVCPASIVCSEASANSGNVVCGGDVDPAEAISLTCTIDGAMTGCECVTAPPPTVVCPSTPTDGTTTCNTDAEGNACCAQQTSPLNYVLSGPQQITQNFSPGSVLEWYQPVHATGQIFSYPASLTLAEARFGRSQGASMPPATNLTQPVGFDTGSGEATESTQWHCSSNSSASVGNANSFSYENSFSITAGSSDAAMKAGEGGQVSVGWDMAYSSSHSTLNSSTVTHVASSGIQVSIDRDQFLTPLESYSYGFTPFLFGAPAPLTVLQDPPTQVCPTDDVDCSAAEMLPTDCSATGPLIAGYSASMTTQQNSWWGATYVNLGPQVGFDLALANPERWQMTNNTTLDPNEQFLRCRGVQPALECVTIQAPSAPPADPSNPTADEVNDIWTNTYYSLRGLITTVNSALGPQRNQAAVGDTVFLQLRVFNYSLADFPQGTTAFARFYRQEVDPTFDADGDIIGLQGYVGAPVVIGSGTDDFAIFQAPTPFAGSAENFTTTEVSYAVDATQADTYWIFWATVWLEDGQGNVLSELAGHGLGSTFSPTTHYRTISEVPLETTSVGVFSNNVGMYKQTFYVAKDTSTATLGVFGRPRADSLSIEGFRALSLLPRPFAPVEVAGDVFSHGAETNGVTVLVSETEPASQGLLLEAEMLPHVRADSSHFFRKAIRPERCGPFDLVARAVAVDGQNASATTSFVVPCEPAVRALKGFVNHTGSRVATLDLSGRFEGPDDLDLRHTEITVESLLREVKGAGELVFDVVRPDAPLVLVPTGKGSRHSVRYVPQSDGASASPAGKANAEATAGHGAQHDELVVTLKRVKDALDLEVRLPAGVVSSPEACRGDPRQTVLETSLLLDDGGGAPLRLVFRTPWQCSERSRRLSLRYEAAAVASGEARARETSRR